MAPARSRVFLYLSLGFTGLCVLVYLVYPFLLRSVGAYLVVEDALQPASAILVLNGESPLRALEAAKIYKEGWAPKVILNQSLRRANFDAYESLDIEVMEQHEYNRVWKWQHSKILQAFVNQLDSKLDFSGEERFLITVFKS